MQSSFGTSVLIDAIGNPNLKWQKTLDKNIGVDIALLGNRLNFNMDYFVKDTDPLLVYITVPSSVGITSVGTNMGSQLTKGINGDGEVFTYISPVRKDQLDVKCQFQMAESSL